MTSLKEKFDKWELIATPIITLFAFIILFMFSQTFLGIEETLNLYVLPFIIGLFIGLLAFILLDRLWIEVNQKTMTKFLRLPSYILAILAVISLIVSNSNIIISMFVLMMGMGTLVSIVDIASISTFYRDYYKNKSEI